MPVSIMSGNRDDLRAQRKSQHAFVVALITSEVRLAVFGLFEPCEIHLALALYAYL
jgi:hypothetical protein